MIKERGPPLKDTRHSCLLFSSWLCSMLFCWFVSKPQMMKVRAWLNLFLSLSWLNFSVSLMTVSLVLISSLDLCSAFDKKHRWRMKMKLIHHPLSLSLSLFFSFSPILFQNSSLNENDLKCIDMDVQYIKYPKHPLMGFLKTWFKKILKS